MENTTLHEKTDTLRSHSDAQQKRYPKVVKAWLIAGLVLIFVQVVVGGITRLTGSGLSITKWEIVTGTLPPTNADQWEEAFDLYKATPQYQKINDGMSMPEFKFIYFWEYFHRLWARMMGFVFIIPFTIFWIKGYFDKMLLRRLGVVFFLAAVVASFGWIMVASGLINRPWVNAYKLTMHLSLAFLLYSYLLWTTYKVIVPNKHVFHSKLLKKWTIFISSLTAFQIVLGGIMSGTKASLYFPNWPDMNGQLIPGVLKDSSMWVVENFVNYDSNTFMVAFIQISHRTTAYALFFIGLAFVWTVFKRSVKGRFRTASLLLISMLIIQMTLGILTLLYSKGVIPVGLGVMHQGGALILLSIALYLTFLCTRQRNVA
jgi:cytochrome c oxidase assembly protein subunit 15